MKRSSSPEDELADSWRETTVQPIEEMSAAPSSLPPPRSRPPGPPQVENAATAHTADDYGRAEIVQAAPVTPSHVPSNGEALRSERPPAQMVVRRASHPPPGLAGAAAAGALAERKTSSLRDPRLVLLLDPDSQRAASFRLLRDNLIARKTPRLIAVSSGAAHEGKTTCAINLALALSELPATRVLLLDANFFAPELGRIFNIDGWTPPVADMALAWLSPYRITEIARGFHVAALVRADGEPAPVFNSRWFDMVMGHLSSVDYDYVIMDAAALDGAPAVAQVVSVADGTLLTARSGGTTARSFRRAFEQIPHGRALGVTLIDGA